jgi:hypothetical protein
MSLKKYPTNNLNKQQTGGGTNSGAWTTNKMIEGNSELSSHPSKFPYDKLGTYS